MDVNKMEKKVRMFLKEQGILRGVESILLAVSGGPDSMALADFMLQRYPEYSYALVHLNHGLRPGADKEESFVRAFGAERRIPVYSKKIDIRAQAEENKLGLEEAGRLARYGYFRELMASLPAQVVLTAHHRDDQAETVLANLLRGCGPEGLAAMAPIECGLGRPFLCVGKADLLAYCTRRGLSYFLDESNADPTFRRNRIRRQLLPQLRDYNPRISEALCRLAALTREDNAALTEAAAHIFSALRTEEEDGLSLGLTELSLSPPAIQSRLVRLAAEAVCPYHVLDYEKTKRVLSLPSGGDVAFGNGLFIRRRHDRLYFSPLPPHSAVERWETAIAVPGETEIPALGWTITVAPALELGPVDEDTAYFPQHWFEETAVLRSRREGDWFFLPHGGHKKLKAFFIDQKIPREARDSRPLLALGSRILWAPGLRVFRSPDMMGPPCFRFHISRNPGRQ